MGATTGSNGRDIGYGSSWNVARMLAGIGAEMLGQNGGSDIQADGNNDL